MNGKTGRRWLNHERRVFLYAVLAGLPGSAVALAMLWTGDYYAKTQWTLTVLNSGHPLRVPVYSDNTQSRACEECRNRHAYVSQSNDAKRRSAAANASLELCEGI